MYLLWTVSEETVDPRRGLRSGDAQRIEFHAAAKF